MPSGYELCTLIIDRVVKHLPKDISNSLIDAYAARVTAHEETDSLAVINLLLMSLAPQSNWVQSSPA